MVADSILDVVDFCKQGWHSVLWVFLVPVTIILIGPAIRPAQAVHQFTFHRMQHYEFAGSLRGSPGVALSCEVRTLSSASVARRCLVVSWKEFLSGDLASLVQKGIVALIVALPRNLSAIGGEDQEAFMHTEQALLKMELQIPVYFVEQSAEVVEWLESLSFHVGHVTTPRTATEELLQQVTGDYYYISSSLYSSKVISDVKISNMIGRIGESSSLQSADQQPVIVLVAHLDCTGVAPGLSYGANSDASGIVAVLEIVRMLGKVVRTQKSSPKTDIIILLSSGGKFNFFGTKKWLEEQTDTTEGSLTGRIQYAVCFDGIGGQFPPNVYVSRPPKEGSPTAKILQMFNSTATQICGQHVPLIHKKINLAEDELVWEHEQFSLTKVPAFTISSVPPHKTTERRSILDVPSGVDVASIAKTIQALGESLASEMYDLPAGDLTVLNDEFLAVSEENIASWMKLLTAQPRSLQSLNADHPVMAALQDYLSKHLQDFKIRQLNGDKGESEIVLHGPIDVSVTASRTKQPFFDLLVTTVIGLYGGIMFLLLQYVDIVRLARSWLRPVVSGSAIKLRAFKSTKYQ